MIRVVGAGPGNKKYLTLEAVEIIQNASKVIAFNRIGSDLKDLREDIIIVEKVSEILELIKEKSDDTAILASGDPTFFGVVEYLKKMNINISEVHPGISSISYFFSKLQKSHQDIITSSVHGRDFDFSKIDLSSNYAFLIDDKKGANYISKALKNLGIKGKLFCGYNLSYEDEKIFSIEIGEEILEPSALGVVVTEFYVD